MHVFSYLARKIWDAKAVDLPYVGLNWEIISLHIFSIRPINKPGNYEITKSESSLCYISHIPCLEWYVGCDKYLWFPTHLLSPSGQGLGCPTQTKTCYNAMDGSQLHVVCTNGNFAPLMRAQAPCLMPGPGLQIIHPPLVCSISGESQKWWINKKGFYYPVCIQINSIMKLILNDYINISLFSACA